VEEVSPNRDLPAFHGRSTMSADHSPATGAGIAMVAWNHVGTIISTR